MTTRRVLVGMMLGTAALLITGCQPSAPSSDKRIQDAKRFVVDLRKTFEGGHLFEGNDPGQDLRMMMVVKIVEKVQYGVSKNEANETRKRAVLARIDEFMKVFDEVGPKYQQAINSRKTESARDLIPYMQRLETQLDQLTALLQGRTA